MPVRFAADRSGLPPLQSQTQSEVHLLILWRVIQFSWITEKV